MNDLRALAEKVGELLGCESVITRILVLESGSTELSLQMLTVGWIAEVLPEPWEFRSLYFVDEGDRSHWLVDLVTTGDALTYSLGSGATLTEAMLRAVVSALGGE